MSKDLDFHLLRMSPYPEGHRRFNPASRLLISDIGAVGRFHKRLSSQKVPKSQCKRSYPEIVCHNHCLQENPYTKIVNITCNVN